MKKKKTLRILISLLIFAGLAYTLFVYLLVSACLVPSFMRKMDYFQEITDKSYAQQVQTSAVKDNHAKALDATKIWCEETPRQRLLGITEDGYRLLACEFLRPEGEEEGHRWVLILHGYTGWKEEMYEFAKWYYEEGYHVIVPDLRCQGSSEGDFIGMGYTDSRDCQIWLNYMLRKDPEADIVLHGQSMGASTALIMADPAICQARAAKQNTNEDGEIIITELDVEEIYSHIRAVVADSAYTDAYSMFGDKITEWFGLPPWPLVDSAVWMLKLRGGYDLRRADALEAISHSQIPVLVIHGVEDAMISVDMAYELYQAAQGPKELLIVEGAGHAQTQDKDPDKYYQTIREFLSG